MKKYSFIVIAFLMMGCFPTKEVTFKCEINVTYTNGQTEIIHYSQQIDLYSDNSRETNPLFLSDKGCIMCLQDNLGGWPLTVRCGVRNFSLINEIFLDETGSKMTVKR